MAKFNPKNTVYLAPYIREGYDNKKFCYWKSLLSYTMGTHAFPDIYTLALGPMALGQVRISGKAPMPMV